ncbi:hypothetical protein [Asaia bogorensis]|uniref:hypothetical protein n=1 Tax=Asaia bogorensis TaxID=91915 RepID=UPI003015DAA9
MAITPYPRELAHPNGFRTVTVYSPDEEKVVQGDFATFRRDHDKAHLAAINGDNLPARRVKETGNV